jgi:hypothetical protein
LKAIRTYCVTTLGTWTSLDYQENSAALTGDAHRFWRVHVRTVGSGTLCHIANVEFRATVSGADLTGSGIAKSWEQAGNPANAFDASTSTTWSGNVTNFTENNTWIGYDLGVGNESAVREILIRARSSSAAAQSPILMEVEWSEDGIHWNFEWQISTTNDWTNSEERVFANPTAVSTPVNALFAKDVLHLQGPGSGAGREVYLHMRTWPNRHDDTWNIQIRAGTGHDTAQDWNNQPGSSSVVTMTLWDVSTIPYWLYVSDRRIICVAKVDIAYTRMYAGFFNPLALPAEYPFPLFVGADSDASRFFYSNYSTTRGCFENPSSDISARWRDWNGLWHNIQHRSGGHIDDYSADNSFIWPKQNGHAFGGHDGDSWFGASNDGMWFERVVATAQSEVPIFECLLGDKGDVGSEPYGVVGALEGVYAAPGISVTAEQTDIKGPDTFRWFPDLDRTGSDHWMLVKEE